MVGQERFINKDGKRLRCGYTTGSCAAAAAKAAAEYLLTDTAPKTVTLSVPAGDSLTLDVGRCEAGIGWARCAVQKDSGDDPDVTHGVWVYATVTRTLDGVRIDGGEGVGRVTKPGLDQPPGAAAINSVPRRMISEGVCEAARKHGYRGGFDVVIAIPEGAILAKKTFNPRLGIVGGISVIGTTGIVQPMSDSAVIETIRTEMKVHRAQRWQYAAIAPGNYGEAFFGERLSLSGERVIQCSNFIGDALDIAGELGFSGLLLAGHLGKLVKLAGGMMNTHSRYGDCRMPLLCAHAARAGLRPQTAEALLAAVTVDEGLRLLEEEGIRDETLRSVMGAICENVRHRAGEMQTEIVLFTNGYGLLAQTEGTDAMLGRIHKETGE